MSDDLDQPATKRYVKNAVDELAQATARGFEKTASKEDLEALRQATKKDMAAMEKRILYHFDAAIEIIEDRLTSANKDEISLIKDQKLPDHEERIQDLEKHAGVPTGPRYATE